MFLFSQPHLAAQLGLHRLAAIRSRTAGLPTRVSGPGPQACRPGALTGPVIGRLREPADRNQVDDCDRGRAPSSILSRSTSLHFPSAFLRSRLRQQYQLAIVA